MADEDPAAALRRLGVTVEVLRPGDAAAAPLARGDQVALHYTLRVDAEGARPLDDTREGCPLSVIAGAGQLLPGAEAALLLMRPGEQVRLRIPSAAAFGRRGLPRLDSRCPPCAGAGLVVEMELLAVGAAAEQAAAPLRAGLPAEGAVRLAAGLRQDGNDAVGVKDHAAAARKYRRCLRVLRRSGGGDPAVRLAAQLNLALCLNHLGRWREAEHVCTAALAADPPPPAAAKAHFRRGTARRAVGTDLAGAVADFECAAELAPGDSAAAAALRATREELRQHQARERAACQAMFKQ
eukprot:TRINITY_DN66582_c0_g1_i1.p1 TRINITY_DN66582_c0_g1~~TRINITY_DN66582_c0_g1_i1.p1  ORF type:complete len:315 (+),score=99.13 TRINITY_DN66582_c0_g1_i1:62-946(+)